METCQDIAERQQHHHVAWIQILLFFFLAKMGPVFNRRLKLRMIPGGDPEEGDKGAAWAGCNKKRRCKHIGCAENRRAKCARTLSLAIEKSVCSAHTAVCCNPCLGSTM